MPNLINTLLARNNIARLGLLNYKKQYFWSIVGYRAAQGVMIFKVFYMKKKNLE